MEIRHFSSIVFCSLLLFATVSSCKKEDIDNGDQGFPLTLTAEKPDRNLLLNWTETKNSDFEAYVIVRSLSPLIDDEAPAGGVIATIDDYKTTTFVDKTVPFVEDIYYKVFAKIGNRFLASPTVHLENNVKLLDMVINRSVFDKENDIAYFFDSAKNSVFKYNYSVGKVVDTLELPGAFDVRMAIGNHGNGNELYIYRSGNFSLDIYNANNLNFITTISTNGFVYSIVSGNNGFLYLATDNWQYNFSVYKRSTKQFVTGDSGLGNGGGEVVLNTIGSDGFNVILANFNNILLYEISSQGLIADQSFATLSNAFFGTPANIPVSDDGQLFIPEFGGSIFNKDLEFFGSLSGNNFSPFSDFAFASNNEKVLAVRSNPSELLEFSFPAIQETKRTLINYQPIRMIADGNDLVIAGLVFDQFGQVKSIVDVLGIE